MSDRFDHRLARARCAGHTQWRAHTWRMLFDPDYADSRFPRCRNLGKHRNAHPVWRMADVLAYFETHGPRRAPAAGVSAPRGVSLQLR